jgi:hypothetical protein
VSGAAPTGVLDENSLPPICWDLLSLAAVGRIRRKGFEGVVRSGEQGGVLKQRGTDPVATALSGSLAAERRV